MRDNEIKLRSDNKMYKSIKKRSHIKIYNTICVKTSMKLKK